MTLNSSVYCTDSSLRVAWTDNKNRGRREKTKYATSTFSSVVQYLSVINRFSSFVQESALCTGNYNHVKNKKQTNQKKAINPIHLQKPKTISSQQSFNFNHKSYFPTSDIRPSLYIRIRDCTAQDAETDNKYSFEGTVFFLWF